VYRRTQNAIKYVSLKHAIKKSVQIKLSETAKHGRNIIHTHVIKRYLIVLGDFRITDNVFEGARGGAFG
jgi:hypothetical protein